MATIPKVAKSRQSLQHGQLGLFGVIMPGVAQVAPAFNLFFTTGLMVGLAGASVPLIFLISMVGMVATASSLAQFSSIYPSAGSFITYITRAIGTKVAVAVGVITILGYIIAFGGIYIFVGSYIVQNVFGNPHIWGLTQIVTIAYGVLVVAPVVIGLKFGVRVTVAVLAIPVWGDLRPGQPAPYSYLPWLTLALIAAGVGYMLVLRALKPRSLDQAVGLLEGEVEAAAGAL